MRLQRSISPWYTLNITDRRVPLTTVVETTHVVDPDARRRHARLCAQVREPGQPGARAPEGQEIKRTTCATCRRSSPASRPRTTCWRARWPAPRSRSRCTRSAGRDASRHVPGAGARGGLVGPRLSRNRERPGGDRRRRAAGGRAPPPLASADTSGLPIAARRAPYPERIGITGGAGFIGSHLCERLLHEGREVIAVDDLSHGFTANFAGVRATTRTSSSTSSTAGTRAELKQVFTGCDAIVAPGGREDPALRRCAPHPRGEHGRAPARPARWRWRSDAFVIVTSTSDVYGNATPPFNEDDRPADRALHDAPLGVRGVEALRRAHGARDGRGEGPAHGDPAPVQRVRAAQPSVVVGQARSTAFTETLLDGKIMEIHGDGRQVRTFTYVTDTVDGFVRALDTPEAVGEILNIGADEPVMILQARHRDPGGAWDRRAAAGEAPPVREDRRQLPGRAAAGSRTPRRRAGSSASRPRSAWRKGCASPSTGTARCARRKSRRSGWEAPPSAWRRTSSPSRYPSPAPSASPLSRGARSTSWRPCSCSCCWCRCCSSSSWRSASTVVGRRCSGSGEWERAAGSSP